MLPTDLFWFWIVAHGGFGLIIGSFLNVVILRRNTGKSLAGRSGCMSCGTSLGPLQLVPVLSWLAQGGRCVHCGSAVRVQYPLVESATGLLFAVYAWLNWSFVQLLIPHLLVVHVLGLVLILLYVVIVTYDIHHTIIPDTWAYAAVGVALSITLISSPTLYFMSPASAAYALVWGIVSGLVVALPLFCMWLFSRGMWMGLGDSKLALSIGCLLGIFNGYTALLISFVVGAVVSVALVIVLPQLRMWVAARGITRLGAPLSPGTMKAEVPFGPFLIFGCIATWFLLLHSHIPGVDVLEGSLLSSYWW